MDGFPETSRRDGDRYGGAHKAEILCPFCGCGGNQVLLTEEFATPDKATHVKITFGCGNGCVWYTDIRTPHVTVSNEDTTVTTEVSVVSPDHARGMLETVSHPDHQNPFNTPEENEQIVQHYAEELTRTEAMERALGRTRDEEYWWFVTDPETGEDQGTLYARDGEYFVALPGVAETAGPFDTEDEAHEFLQFPWDMEYSYKSTVDQSVVGKLYDYKGHWFARRGEDGPLMGPFEDDDVACEQALSS